MFWTDPILQLCLFGNLDSCPLGYSYPPSSTDNAANQIQPSSATVKPSLAVAKTSTISKCNKQTEKIAYDIGNAVSLQNIVNDPGTKTDLFEEADRKQSVEDICAEFVYLEGGKSQRSKIPLEALFFEEPLKVSFQDRDEVESLKAKIDEWISSDRQSVLKWRKLEDFRKSRHWKPRNYDVSEAMYKMAKNSLRTVRQFRAQPERVFWLDGLATPAEALDALVNPSVKDGPLAAQCLSEMCQNQGRRPYMEDVSFIKQNDDRIISGVFDGHSADKKTGLGVAKYVKECVERNLDRLVGKYEGNVHKAMENLFWIIQSKLGAEYREFCKDAGTTAVVTYIDKKSRLMYVATIGDSEATIYRRIDGVMKAIPASRLLNWSSPSEARRAADFYDNEGLYWEWVSSLNPKELRSMKEGGINISRTLGDFNHTGNDKFPLISSEPELTVFPLEEGDVVILASDGVEDYISKEIVSGVVSDYFDEFEGMAEKIMKHAYHQGQSSDNISVVAIKISA